METSCPLGHWLILGLMRRRGSDFRVSNFGRCGFQFRFSDFGFRISIFGFRFFGFPIASFVLPYSPLPIPYSLFSLERRRGKAPSVGTRSRHSARRANALRQPARHALIQGSQTSKTDVGATRQCPGEHAAGYHPLTPGPSPAAAGDPPVALRAARRPPKTLRGNS